MHARYDLISENDETRREKYERMGKFVPSFEIPVQGIYLWEWFGQLCKSVHRIDFNGNYCVIGPSEIFAWSNLTNNLITPIEYDILSSMDMVFCDELNKEIQARHAKEEEKRKQESQAARARSRIRRR